MISEEDFRTIRTVHSKSELKRVCAMKGIDLGEAMDYWEMHMDKIQADADTLKTTEEE